MDYFARKDVVRIKKRVKFFSILMNFANIIVILIYILLIIANYNAYKQGKDSYTLSVLTGIVATLLLFSSNVASFDWSETELDLSGYRTIYEQYDVLEHPDFNMYFIFYGIMYLCQNMGMSFFTWWAVMSIIGMSVIAIACRVHKFNYNLFLASFMAYYEFAYYSGFKFFYGFCFFLLAYGFLLRDEKFAKLKYILFLLIACGFHSMYYYFFLFLIRPKKDPKYFVGAIAIASVIFTILIRLSGSAMSFLAPFFDMLDNEHINKYTVLNVNLGFYLPIFLQVVMIYIAVKIRRYRDFVGLPKQATDALYYTSILSLVFCPFYALALTFSRLQSAFSLVLITANSIHVTSRAGRTLNTNMSILMVAAFWLNIIVSGLQGFIGHSVIPFFDIF